MWVKVQLYNTLLILFVKWNEINILILKLYRYNYEYIFNISYAIFILYIKKNICMEVYVASAWIVSTFREKYRYYPTLGSQKCLVVFLFYLYRKSHFSRAS